MLRKTRQRSRFEKIISALLALLLSISFFLGIFQFGSQVPSAAAASPNLITVANGDGVIQVEPYKDDLGNQWLKITNNKQVWIVIGIRNERTVISVVDQNDISQMLNNTIAPKGEIKINLGQISENDVFRIRVFRGRNALNSRTNAEFVSTWLNLVDGGIRLFGFPLDEKFWFEVIQSLIQKYPERTALIIAEKVPHKLAELLVEDMEKYPWKYSDFIYKHAHKYLTDNAIIKISMVGDLLINAIKTGVYAYDTVVTPDYDEVELEARFDNNILVEAPQPQLVYGANSPTKTKLSVKIINNGTYIDKAYVAVDIISPDGKKIENTWSPSPDPETGKIGKIRFNPDFLATTGTATFFSETPYDFGEPSSTGHKYKGGFYTFRYAVWIGGYPGEPGSTRITPVMVSKLEIRDSIRPSKPEYFQAFSEAEEVTLLWSRNDYQDYSSAPKDTDIAKYEIRRSTALNGVYELIDKVDHPQATYTDANVLNGRPYFYKIRVIDTGNQYTDSDIVSATPKARLDVKLTSDKSAYNEGDKATFDITISRNATGESVDADSFSATFDGSNVSSAITKISTGKYRYVSGNLTRDSKVFSLTANKSGYNSGSEEIQILVANSLSIPTGLIASGGNSKVNLYWNANPEANILGYKIYRSNSAGGPFDYLDLTYLPYYADNDVASGNIYYYKISAYDMTENESMLSDYKAASPASVASLTISGVDVAPSSTSQNSPSPIPVAQLVLNSNTGTINLNKIKVKQSGTANSNDVEYAYLYDDANGNGEINSGEQQIAAAQYNYEGKYPFVELNLPVSSSAPRKLIVAYQVKADAGTNKTLGMSLSKEDVAVNSPNEISASGLPFSTKQVSIKSGDTLGPSLYNLVANPTMIFSNGQTIDIKATAEDMANLVSTNNIAGAEYFIDQVGADGAGISMVAEDGNFDSKLENITAAISANGWSNGLHKIYIHAKDTLGNWGQRPHYPIYVSIGKLSVGGTPFIWSKRVLAKDSSGNLHMIFNANSRLWYSKSNDSGKNWSDPMQVSPDSLQVWRGASIDIDNNNRIHYVFGSSNFGNRDLYYNAINSDGSFLYGVNSPQKLVSGSAQETHPRIAVDNNGKLHIVYRYELSNEVSPGDPQIGIYYITNESGGWSNPRIISESTTPGSDGSNEIAVDASNNLHVVFVATKLYYSSRINGSWSDPYEIAASVGTDSRPSIATINNDIMVAYDDNNEILVRKRDLSGWNTAQNISNSSEPSTGPTIYKDKNGYGYVAWQESRSLAYPPWYGDTEIYYSVSKDSGLSWGSPANISRTLGLESAWPGASRGKNIDGLEVVWAEGNSDPYMLEYKNIKEDNILPAVQIVSPASNQTLGSNVLIKGTADGENLDYYQVEYGAGDSPTAWEVIAKNGKSVSNDTLALWDTSTLSSGKYTIKLTASKINGLKNSASITVNLDNSPPEVSNLSASPSAFSPNGDGMKDSTTISFDISEESNMVIGITNLAGQLIKILTDGSLMDPGNNILVWDGKDRNGNVVSDGIYKIYAQATDSQGNVSAVQTANAIVDNSQPVALMENLSESTPVKGIISLNGTASDVNISYYKVEYAAESDPNTWKLLGANFDPIISSNVLTLNTNNLPNGKGSIKLSVTDEAGNLSSAVAAIQVDNVFPIIQEFLTPIYSTDISPTKGFDVEWQGQDIGTGIAGYQIQIRPHTTSAWSTWRIDGSDWTTKTKARLLSGKPGYTYYLRSRVKDGAGNISGWSNRRTMIPVDDRTLSYTTGWKNANQVTCYKNTLKYASRKGESGTLVFTGRSLILIAPKGRNKGKLEVYVRNKVNGKWSAFSKIKTIDLYSEKLRPRVPIAIKSWTSMATHQVRFVVAGSKNPKSSGFRVDIDGVATLK